MTGKGTRRADVVAELAAGFRDREEALLRDLDSMKGRYFCDQRWLAIGRTGLEQAFMAINRSLIMPERAALPGDESPE